MSHKVENLGQSDEFDFALTKYQPYKIERQIQEKNG